MQLACGVVDSVPLAECVEAVALTGVKLARERQRVEDMTVAVEAQARITEPCEFMVDERDIERRIVDDHLGAGNKRQNLRVDIGEAWLCPPGSHA